MITVEDNRSLIGKSLEAKMARLRNLSHADKAARSAVLKRLRGISFRAAHASSHLMVDNGRIELGSRQPGYFKLLSLDGERLGSIYAAWVVEGSTRG